MEMDPIPGYEIASWGAAGDFAMARPGDVAPDSVARRQLSFSAMSSGDGSQLSRPIRC